MCRMASRAGCEASRVRLRGSSGISPPVPGAGNDPQHRKNTFQHHGSLGIRCIFRPSLTTRQTRRFIFDHASPWWERSAIGVHIVSRLPYHADQTTDAEDRSERSAGSDGANRGCNLCHINASRLCREQEAFELRDARKALSTDNRIMVMNRVNQHGGQGLVILWSAVSTGEVTEAFCFHG